MTDPKNEKPTWVEEMEVAGNDLVATVKRLMEEGNVRRLIIRKPDGEAVMELPLTPSVIAGSALVVFALPLAALGAVAAFLAQVRIEVVRDVDDDGEKSKKQKIDVE